MSARSVDVPVMIVGDGGCGLSSSIFLSDFDVPHLLVERPTGTSILSKAHCPNQLAHQRAMEIFDRHGVAEAIYEVGAPLERFGHVRWMTSLAVASEKLNVTVNGVQPGVDYLAIDGTGAFLAQSESARR